MPSLCFGGDAGVGKLNEVPGAFAGPLLLGYAVELQAHAAITDLVQRASELQKLKMRFCLYDRSLQGGVGKVEDESHQVIKKPGEAVTI